MKRIISWILCMSLLLSSCGTAETPRDDKSDSVSSSAAPTEEKFVPEEVWVEGEPPYSSLEDEQLLAYVEDLVYQKTISAMDNDKYLIEEVRASYISKEYLEEVEYNAQSNIYFGYTLSELNDLFRGNKYVFTSGKNGKTTVQELKEITTTTTERVLKNVAVGSGVILICVTISVASAGVAPAVSAIFAVSATTAKAFAESSAILGGVSSGIVRGLETGDFGEAVKAAALGAGEGFKWGAISGAVVGGSIQSTALVQATKGGLTMNEAAVIQADSQLPINVISQIHSMDEYEVYKAAGLKSVMVNGRTALVPKIDLKYVSTLPDGTKITNLERMVKGRPPIDPLTGKAYELHHVGQKNDGVLAALTWDQHHGEGNFPILHTKGNNSGVDHGAAWNRTVKEFWKAIGNAYLDGGV